MSLLRQGKAEALTIYLGESDQWQGQPLYVAIIHYLRAHGCAGATVLRAVAGYGAGSRLHANAGWQWSSDAPLVIQVIDQPDRLRRLLPELQGMLSGGLLTLHEVEVLKYTHARSRGLPTGLPVRQVMETGIITVGPEAPVASVIDLLLEAPFRVLPVVDTEQHLLGIISTGDLINAGVLPVRRGVLRTALTLDRQTAEAVEEPLAHARQRDLRAQDVMNRQVRTIVPDAPIRDAAKLMLETSLRRLPVAASDGRLLGMLSRADLLQLVVTSPLISPHASTATQPLPHPKSDKKVPIQQRPIANFQSTEATTITEDAPLAEVLDALILSPLKRVIVVDAERHVRGIISDVDVLAQLSEASRPGFLRLFTNLTRSASGRLPSGAIRAAGGQAHRAADVMNREVVTVSESTTVQEAIERMMTTGRKLLPVVDAGGHLTGVIGRSALLRVLVEGAEER